jgi:hypothetical protein
LLDYDLYVHLYVPTNSYFDSLDCSSILSSGILQHTLCDAPKDTCAQLCASGLGSDVSLDRQEPVTSTRLARTGYFFKGVSELLEYTQDGG